VFWSVWCKGNRDVGNRQVLELVIVTFPLSLWNVSVVITRCSAIAERPRCRVRYSFGKKWKTGTGRQYLQPLWYNRPEICRIRWKIRKIRAITALKVIQGHRVRYQLEARMRVARFIVIAAYSSNFGYFAFWATFWGVFKDNVRCSSWAHWKTRSGLSIVLFELFLLRVTAESLRAKRDRKSAIPSNAVSLIQNFR